MEVELPCRPQAQAQAVRPAVMKARAVRVTLVVQMALQATRAPVEAARESLVARPVELRGLRRHSTLPCRAEMPWSWAARLGPQNKDRVANSSSSILFEE